MFSRKSKINFHLFSNVKKGKNMNEYNGQNPLSWVSKMDEWNNVEVRTSLTGRMKSSQPPFGYYTTLFKHELLVVKVIYFLHYYF